MIIDRIENFQLYAGINNKIAKAFEYINNTDLTKTPLGKHIISDDQIFALVQEYETKEKRDCKLESHLKYIDVQYIISGVEFIGITTLVNQKVVIKNVEDDFIFYDGDSNLIKFEEGRFGIFFPNDLHMPGIKFNQISKVRKVVVKVKI